MSGAGDMLEDAAAARPQRQTLEKMAKVNQLAQAMGELSGIYSMLEEAFMAATVLKAIQTDEISDDARTSMVSEDAFYIVQKCARRAINTGSSDCACTVVNHVSAILSRQVLPELVARIKSDDKTGHFARLRSSLQALIQAGAAEANLIPDDGSVANLQDLPKVKDLTASAGFWANTLNNLSLCTENSEKLRQSLDEELLGVFADDLTQAKVRSCLAELDSTAAEFRKTLQSQLSRLCASLTPRFRGVMTPMEGHAPVIHYNLTEDEYSHLDTYNVFTTEFLDGVRGIISPFKAVLYGKLYTRMVLKVAAYIAKQIESSVRRRKFNHLGGLYLDRNVRALVSMFVTEASGDRGARERLARLVEVSRLLSCADAHEVAEYCNDSLGGPMTLSEEDTQAFLALRVDIV